MSNVSFTLTYVLEQVLRDNYADEETGKLPLKESQWVRQLIRDYLEITDTPLSLDPYQIADFIYRNCESSSKDAAERWLRSMTDQEIGQLELSDVLMALVPGYAGDIEELVEENEEERRDEEER